MKAELANPTTHRSGMGGHSASGDRWLLAAILPWELQPAGAWAPEALNATLANRPDTGKWKGSALKLLLAAQERGRAEMAFPGKDALVLCSWLAARPWPAGQDPALIASKAIWLVYDACRPLRILMNLWTSPME